jgi:transposase
MDALLFPPPSGVAAMITQPDWAAIHLEYKRQHVTLMLLWEEYRAVHPDGYGYSRFCDLYRRWEGEYPKLCVWVSAHAVETGHRLNRSG